MTGIEITLLLVGIVFMVGSFLVTEKLSNSELDKVSELSENEIKKILEKELGNAKQGIDDEIDEAIENSVDKVDRALEKETNEKIMAISEFSDTVMENMNKTHNEIMFLYSMLNDKHAAMTQYTEDLQKMMSDLDKQKEECQNFVNSATSSLNEQLLEEEEHLQTRLKAEEEQMKEEEEILPEEVTEEETTDVENISEEVNHNAKILELHKQGMSNIQIAKELGLGMGEVKLVLGLFREEEAE